MADLAKKYSFEKEQQNCIAKWKALGVYSFDKSCTDQKSVFSVDTPPPTISGSLHIGHTFSYCQTDFIARFYRMLGLISL